jgi:SAM-dependent methyltransferase
MVSCPDSIKDHPGGLSTDWSLETLARMDRYSGWIYSLMEPHLGSRVLELGAGIGNLTRHLLEQRRHVTAIDIEERMVHLHRARIPAGPRLGVECISLEEFAARPGSRGRFDAVVSSNVLEHIEAGADEETLRAAGEVLRPGGCCIHWVPAMQAIYGTLDQAFGHQRRYSRSQLRELLQKTGFEVLACEYWNMPGCFGWWLSGRVLGATAIPPGSALVFDRYLVPVLRRVEPRLWRPFGQSLLIVGRKPVSG